MGVDRAIAVIAARQHGYATRRQLLEAGIGARTIDHRVKEGRLIPVYAGVYAVGHLPGSPIARAAAAVLACGPGAALSHSSAATLWGFLKRWRTPLEVTAPAKHRRAGVLAHRSCALRTNDVSRHLGIRVTSPARTILDAASGLSDRALTRAVNDALLSRYLRRDDLEELLARCPCHPGVTRVRRFANASSAPTRSQLEDSFVAFARSFGLPLPEINARVAGYEVDALFRRERVIVELDGYEFHSSRTSFENDRNRDADTLAAGFTTVRLTWARLKSAPAGEARRLHSILSSA